MSDPNEHVHSTVPGVSVTEGAGLGEDDLPEDLETETVDVAALDADENDKKDYEDK